MILNLRLHPQVGVDHHNTKFFSLTVLLKALCTGYMNNSTECDEDIAMLDTSTPSSLSSCNSSPTQLPRHSRIQQTRRQCFDHIFFIRHRNVIGTDINRHEGGPISTIVDQKNKDNLLRTAGN